MKQYTENRETALIKKTNIFTTAIILSSITLMLSRHSLHFFEYNIANIVSYDIVFIVPSQL